MITRQEPGHIDERVFQHWEPPNRVPFDPAACFVGGSAVSAIPGGLRPLLEDLWDNDIHSVTVEDVAARAQMLAGVDMPAGEIIHLLEQAGWLTGADIPGVWRSEATRRPVLWPALMARLKADPGCPARIAGLSLIEAVGWAARPYADAVGFPPGRRVPRCFRAVKVHRWEPKTPPLMLHGDHPAWSFDTLVAYMAAKPAGFYWGDVGDFLFDVCARVTAAGLAAELADRSRAAWMRAALILDHGEAPETAEQVFDAAPAGRGPYRFGKMPEWSPYSPQWHPKYQLLDETLAHWWCPRGAWL